jgi:hypothetical protein
MRHRTASLGALPAGVLVLAAVLALALSVSGCANKASSARSVTTAAAPKTSATAGAVSAGEVLAPPAAGSLYHGVYPGGKTGEEDDITAASTDEYEAAVGHKVAWVYFSNNWYKSAKFPASTCQWIAARGSVPYIRLMLRSNIDPGTADPTFSLDRIIKGDFDPQLKAWARDAASFGKPVMAEYGPEVNGDWFPWNGSYNGAGTTTGFGDPKKADGPERFVAAYRHIIDVMRQEKAYNVSWVFHVDVYGFPDEPWNSMPAYYPGDDYIDWLAVSAYGAQDPADDGAQSFRDLVDAGYTGLAKVSPTKPIIVAEMGTDVRNTLTDPAVWSKAALTDMFAKRWPRLAGFCWWDERWANDGDPANDSDMRIQDSPAVTKIFRDVLGADASRLIERPVVARRGAAK